MTKDRERFTKIVAIAMDPGAFEDEAIAALRKARELIRQDPGLKDPQPEPEQPPKIEPPQASFKARITNVHGDWTPRRNQQSWREGLWTRPSEQDYLRLFGSPVRDRRSMRWRRGRMRYIFRAPKKWLVDYVNRKVAEDK